MWIDAVKKNGSKKKSLFFKPCVQQPLVMTRNLDELVGPRYARRPSKLARAQHAFNGTHLNWADEYDPPDSWENGEEMPLEAKLEDCQWLPGPASRDKIPFAGPAPGPTDRNLLPSSSPEQFLKTQLTPQFRQKVVSYTHAHCAQYRTNHADWESSCIEKSMLNFKKKFNVGAFDAWLACRLRIAELKQEIKAISLWERNSHLFDPMVFNIMTFNQYCWISRHISFADVEEIDTEAEDEDPEDEADSDHEDVEPDEYFDEEADEGTDTDVAVHHRPTSHVTPTVRGAS